MMVLQEGQHRDQGTGIKTGWQAVSTREAAVRDLTRIKTPGTFYGDPSMRLSVLVTEDDPSTRGARELLGRMRQVTKS